MGTFLVGKWRDAALNLSAPHHDCLGVSSFHASTTGAGSLLFAHYAGSGASVRGGGEKSRRAALLRAGTAAHDLLSRARAAVLLTGGTALAFASRAYGEAVSTARSVPSTCRMVAWSLRSG